MAAICRYVDVTCRLRLAVKYVYALSKLAVLGTSVFLDVWFLHLYC